MQIMERKRFASLTMLLVVALTSVVAVAASDADKSPVPQDAASRPASVGSQAFIVHNPDGTFTVQKAGDTKAGKGLVIPPQVIVPVFSPSRK